MGLSVAIPKARKHTSGVPLEDYLTTAEAARALGITKNGVIQLIHRELLVAQMVGNRLFIHKDEVRRYMRERKKPGKPRQKRKYDRKTSD